jgi:hypothetical protein
MPSVIPYPASVVGVEVMFAHGKDVVVDPLDIADRTPLEIVRLAPTLMPPN